MAYSQKSDLILGDLELGASINADAFVQDASDEIDIAIGHRYKIPVEITSETPRLTAVTLKRIAAYLSSGRILLAAAQNDERLHSLGRYYINQAQTALAAISTGEFLLEGAEPAAGDSPADTGPRISNEDSGSLVEVFYNMTSQDPAMFPYPLQGYYPQRMYGG